MDLFVLRQVVVANKCFPTLVALVPLVIVMDSQVKSVGAAVAEALPTDAAEMRLLPAVDPHVLLQRGSLSHGLPADEAGPLSLPAVRALYVALQVPRVIELAAADVARKGTQMELFLML